MTKWSRSVLFGALGALTVATAVGCGQTPLVAPMALSSLPSDIDAQGVSHAFGFDFQRYETEQAPKAHPQHLASRQGMLPSLVDLRPHCPPVYDQGKLGSCTAFAMGKGLREILAIKNSGQDTPLSALYFYYHERMVDGDVNQDGGSTTTTGMGVLKNTGIAPETDDPYSDNRIQFKVAPSAQAETDAAPFKLNHPVQITSLDIKTALANGQPVVLGFTVFKSFMSIGKDGLMPMPGPSKTDRNEGGHEICIVGYDDSKQALIVRNSWGTSWGDQGYFYMPYAFVANERWANDIWTAAD